MGVKKSLHHGDARPVGCLQLPDANGGRCMTVKLGDFFLLQESFLNKSLSNPYESCIISVRIVRGCGMATHRTGCDVKVFFTLTHYRSRTGTCDVSSISAL